MRAVVMHETGGPEVLRYEETERPEPADGEVLIRVRAASVNPVDWKSRRGFVEKQLPAVLGLDVSGTVEKSRTEAFAEGDDVFGYAGSGGYAELATASAKAIAKKPAAVSHEEAAAIPVAGLTAWQALFDRGELQSGQAALIAGEPELGAARPDRRPDRGRRFERGDRRGGSTGRGPVGTRAQRVRTHAREDHLGSEDVSLRLPAPRSMRVTALSSRRTLPPRAMSGRRGVCSFRTLARDEERASADRRRRWRHRKSAGGSSSARRVARHGGSAIPRTSGTARALGKWLMASSEKTERPFEPLKTLKTHRADHRAAQHGARKGGQTGASTQTGGLVYETEGHRFESCRARSSN
jgi:hypothetical protein